MKDFIIAHNKDMLAKFAADFILAQAREAILERGFFNIALSGGSTPRETFLSIARNPEAAELNWRKVRFFWSDERTVSPSHPDSNYHMAHETLLMPLGIPPTNIFRVESELSPQMAAEKYGSKIKDMLGTIPVFDLVLLGLGEDGHTASLFPETKALEPTDQLIVANWVKQQDSWRITFTPYLINQARHVAFLVSGEKKAKILQEVIEGNNPYPAKKIKPIAGKLTWLLDKAAARYLSGTNQ